jgi:lipoprotein-anchoring transpeptidase ErfK/SrfK
LPSRFRTRTDTTSGVVHIEDSETGKQAEVPMGAWGATRNALGALFGGAPEKIAPADVKAVPAMAAEEPRAGAASPGRGKARAAKPAAPAAKAASSPKAAASKTVPAAKVSPVATFEKVDPSSGKIPDGWEKETTVAGTKLRLVFGADPETQAPSYAIIRKGVEIGRLRADHHRNEYFQLYSPKKVFETTRHRNLKGAMITLSVNFAERVDA